MPMVGELWRLSLCVMNKITLQTDRTNVVMLAPSQARLMQAYYVENWRFLKPWEPTRGDEYYSYAGWQHILGRYHKNFELGKTLNLAALNLANNEVIALCNFSNIVHGPMKSCHLGYSIAQKYQGQGLMYEILKPLITQVMNHYQLHRVCANHMPHNERSAALLKRLGFEKEGYARSYLQIDGQWQDHVLNAFIEP